MQLNNNYKVTVNNAKEIKYDITLQSDSAIFITMSVPLVIFD